MSNWVCASCGGENPEGMRFCGHCGAFAAAAASEPEQPAAGQGGSDVAEALRSFVVGSVADRLVQAGGKLPEERRLITALFADVSGFTSLADRLDPEQLLEVIDPVIAGLSSIVGRYDGYVEKFAGDALLALFGAPVSHDDDAARALRVALEMHQELARIVRGLPYNADLTLHVGVNSGHGIARVLGSEARMDYAVLGDSVILAQRLESSAPPGDTYVSETTVRLTEGEFEFESVGALILKGKTEPVPAWRLVGERNDMTTAVRHTLIGRESELTTIEAALTRLQHGGGEVIAITGEPGIGKSRLMEVAQDRAIQLGARWLQARCISYGAGLAYWPYLDLVRRFAGLQTDEDSDATMGRLETAFAQTGSVEAVPFFARLLGLPVDDERVAGLEPEAFRRGLHGSFRSWFAALSAERPVVLAVEDLHWSDASSLELTAELARLSSETPVLLVLVGRPEARQRIETVVGDLDRHSIELGPLDPAGIAQLADTILGGSAPEQLVAFVERRTSGNPFFAEELVRALRDRGALVLADRGWTLRAGWDERELPPTIEGVLAARIDLLPRDAVTLLQTASVIGRRIRVPLLEAVAGDGHLETPIEELVRGGFLDRAQDDDDEVVIFHHALVQDAAYSRLLRRRSRELHLRVAEVAESLYGSGDHVIDLLARHLYLGGSSKAPEYLVRAGERAKRLFANSEAILHLTRAGELAPDDHEIRLGLADLHELVGEYDDALRLYTEGRDRARGDVRAWRGIASTHRRRGEYIEALSTVNAAFASEALKGADLTPLWLEAGWNLYNTGHVEESIDVLNAGLEAVDSHDSVALGHLLVHLSHAEILAGRFEDALQHGLDAQGLMERHDDLRGLASATRVTGDAYRLLGRLDEAASTLWAGLEIAERIGSIEEIGGCLINLGVAELERGALDEAIACDRRAIAEFERIGHGSGRAIGYSNLAFKLGQAGEYDDAVAMCERALDVARSIRHPMTIAETMDTLAFVELRRGNSEAAAEHAEDAAEQFLELGSERRASETLSLASDAWEQANEPERARAARDRARSLVSVPT